MVGVDSYNLVKNTANCISDDKIGTDRFEKFSGPESLPFPARKHQSTVVTVIDLRGNEAMRAHDLWETWYA